VTARRAFGISTHLYHNHRLTRDHLLEVGAHGFERVELFATRTHFDYQNPAAVADLQQWLAEAALELNSVHAPIGESFNGGRWGPPLTLASSDPETRERALSEAERALQIARRIPFGVLVAHIGLPRTQQPTPADNSRDAARRSIETLQQLAEPLGVRVALEVIPN
jgi:sugar phosphate isomerase/epimerase